MNAKTNNRKSYFEVLFLLIIINVLIGIISNPQLSLESAISGLSTWLNIIIPSLLPFLIISELLIRLGFVDLIGKLLQPVMIFLFNVPGEGAFPLSMSLLSGYPVGSKITSRLRKENIISKKDGDKLICFTSTSGPLFMIGAVSIGMLKDPNLAILIILPHYLSILLLGLLFKYYKSSNIKTIKIKNKNLYEEIHDSYKNWIKTKVSIGTLITDSIKDCMDTIILIGGLIIFYSVLIEILFNMKIIDNIINYTAIKIRINPHLIKGGLIGLIEMTTGCKTIATANTSIMNKIILINFIIGWGGLSVHSQALSFINNTDINNKLYILSKLLHGIFSAILGCLIYLVKFRNYTKPIFLNYKFVYNQFDISNWLYLFKNSIELAIAINVFILILSIFTYIFLNNSRDLN